LSIKDIAFLRAAKQISRESNEQDAKDPEKLRVNIHPTTYE
jgi:hypothetical protein